MGKLMDSTDVQDLEFKMVFENKDIVCSPIEYTIKLLFSKNEDKHTARIVIFSKNECKGLECKVKKLLDKEMYEYANSILQDVIKTFNTDK